MPELFEDPKKYAGAVDLRLDFRAHLDSATMLLMSGPGPKVGSLHSNHAGYIPGFRVSEKLLFSMD
jgi:hypothetical protein